MDMPDAVAKRILVVDDAGLVRLYYREALERAGYVVDEALNGLEALERLLVTPVDLLIVDINMPQMDGLTFLRVLRGQGGPGASIPAMVTSTESGPQDRAAVRNAGANFYLVKPVSREMLVEHAGLLCGTPA
jgi:two-component system chemotaxis response regulator CheY